MFRRSTRLLLAVAALAGVAGASAGRASADPPFFFDVCKAVAPHASLNLGVGVPSVDTTSANIYYASGLCPRFVVDIFVPTTSSGGPGYFADFAVGGGYAGTSSGSTLGGLPLAQVHCGAYQGHLSVYRKTAFGGEFTYVGGGGTPGQWVPNGGLFGPYCALVKNAGFVDLPAFSPPSLATVVYRVAVGATVHGFSARVRAGASHYPIVS